MRIYKGKSIGCDPGKNGAIALVKDGSIVSHEYLSAWYKTTGRNQVLSYLDPRGLNEYLLYLYDQCDRFVLEVPPVVPYTHRIGKNKGKAQFSLDSLTRLWAQIGQIHHAVTAIGFNVITGDPQCWQGYHGLAAQGSKSVKDVTQEIFFDHNPESRGKYSEAVASGIADAWAIAQYVYQDPPAKMRKIRERIQYLTQEQIDKIKQDSPKRFLDEYDLSPFGDGGDLQDFSHQSRS